MGDTDVSRMAAAKVQMKNSVDVEELEAAEAGLANRGLRVSALGVHVDEHFRGSYEDLEHLRKTLSGDQKPILVNDFVLYAYQLFKAKSNGADAIKLHASILPPNEISYMSKIAPERSI